MLAVGKKIRIGDIITFDSSFVKSFQYGKLYNYKKTDYDMFLSEMGIDISFFESITFKKVCALYNINYEKIKDIYINQKNIKYEELDTDYITLHTVSYERVGKMTKFNKTAFVVDFIKEKDTYKTYGKYICKDIYGNYIFPNNVEKVKNIGDIDLTIEQYSKIFCIINNINYFTLKKEGSHIIERSYTEFVRKYNLYWINRIE